MTAAAPTRRWFLRRAIERGDPRLGLLVGAAVSLLVAFAFAQRLVYARVLDNKALDLALLVRPRIRESDLILHVDMDDNTIRELDYPISRKYYAQVVSALTRLGAREIIFDVEFQTHIPRDGDYDESTGDFFLSDHDREFRAALAQSDRVTLAYHFEGGDPIRFLRSDFPKFKEAFAGNVARGAEELAARTGIPAARFRDDLEKLRYYSVMALAADRLRARPETTFSELRQALLPNPEASLTRLLQHAYWVVRTTVLLERTAFPVTIEGLPAQVQQGYAILPPRHPFAELARDGGFSNAEADAEDGILRRPWAYFRWGDRLHFYLGFVAAVRAFAGEGERPEVVVRPREVEVRARADSDGTVRRSVLLPVDENGRLLVNWAGNYLRNRKKPDPKDQYFSHLPFPVPVTFFEERYRLLDEGIRKWTLKVSEENGEPYYPDYAKLSDRRKEIMSGRTPGSAREFRVLESRLDEIHLKIVEELRSEVAELEKAIAKEQRDRLKLRLQENRDKRKKELDSLTAPLERERELRKRVAGKVCFIGSAYTASGDLHSTPLGVATPGVDVHSNVANMVLTGQVLRRSPGWINFLYVLVVGFLVSLVVTYWNTGASAAASAGLTAAWVAAYGLVLAGASVLLSGAGPVVSAVLSFAGTTAYKQLVTQRSKRKLQRALETKTSPELVEILLEHPEIISMPRKMAGTFLFSDVKSFTSMTEKMAAESLFPFINRYLDRMTQPLKRHQAYVDKYIGDGIMALFGIPVPSPTHARDACRAALECQTLLQGLNAEFQAGGLPKLISRVGIHSGEASAGYVGASDRSDYTVLGDNVNLASRLEGANKEYDTTLMISEATHELVAGQFVVRELDRIRVVGKRNAVRIFELVGEAGASLPFDPRFLEAYEAALRLFKERRWPEAIEGFERALALKPVDRPCSLYIARASAFVSDPPPPDWEGVFELTSK